MQKKYTTIIFDLDGTLLDTLQDLADSVNHVLEEHLYPLHTIEDIRQFVGNGVARLMELSLPQGCSNPEYQMCLQEFKEYYAVHMLDTTAPYPGILSMLDTLHDKGIKIAIVSNKFDGAVKGLNQQFFSKTISVAIGESATVAKKPAPDTVLKALEELHSTPQESVYVGDSDVDILTAKNTHMDCISVLWGFRDKEFLKQHGASCIVATPSELLKAGGFL
ncbi:MAG: HAD family hydrolase [Lachnospiraceae bacterium]